MYEAFGLKVDMPTSEEAVTSTTRNVFHKAFSNQALLSKVLGIDKSLIIRLSNILITINFNNSVEFTNYCNETYKSFFDFYGNWCKVTASIHKIFAHGADIILNSPLPVVALGEEASECRNKFYSTDRENHEKTQENPTHSMYFDEQRILLTQLLVLYL